MPTWIKNLPRNAFIGLIQLYRWTLSPYLGRFCRFQPTCSVYAQEALRRHGALKGGWLSLKRLGRCHPFGASGFDPVPPCGKSTQPRNP
jgi:putative membrane protein insertion efficiency factor